MLEIVVRTCRLQDTITGGNTENLSPLQKIHTDKYFDPNGPKKSESLPNCYTKLSQEPVRHVTQSQNPISVQPADDHNESMITMNSVENTPLTSKNESNDLRKYVKMVSGIEEDFLDENILLIFIRAFVCVCCELCFTDCRNAFSERREFKTEK